MNYGYFDDHNREYIITNPRTPAKWINCTGGRAEQDVKEVLVEVTLG